MSFSLSSWFDARFFKTGNNAPLTGGKIYTYLAGTTTPVATYSNDSGTTNTNPIILDADGRANIYLDDSVAYRFILKDANDVTQKDVDNIRSSRVDIIQKASTIADLRLLIGTSANSNAVATLGYYVAGDGGGNTFYWDSTSGVNSQPTTWAANSRRFNNCPPVICCTACRIPIKRIASAITCRVIAKCCNRVTICTCAYKQS